MKQLGAMLREHFSGWDAAILTGSPDAGLELGLRAERVHTVWNGALECRLLRIHVSAENREAAASTPAAARASTRRSPTVAGRADVRQPHREEPQAAREAGPSASR